MRHVELEEAWAGGVCRGDGLDSGGAGGGERVGEVELVCYLGGGGGLVISFWVSGEMGRWGIGRVGNGRAYFGNG